MATRRVAIASTDVSAAFDIEYVPLVFSFADAPYDGRESSDIASTMIGSVEVCIGPDIVQYVCGKCGFTEGDGFGALKHHDKCPLCGN